jgi:arginine decarboxylase
MTREVMPIGTGRRRFLRMLGGGVAFGGLALSGAFGPALAAAETGLVFGNRVPRNWYWFQGLGTSDKGYGSNPYETFAYDSALNKGGIEDYNVVPYTSVLPRIAHGNVLRGPTLADGTIARPREVAMTPGSVLEVIMSPQGMTVAPGKTGTVATGLGIMWAAERATPDTLRNGYAAEYEIAYPDAVDKAKAEQAARSAVEESLQHELKIRGLVPFRRPDDPAGRPEVVILASHVENTTQKPLFAYQITGIGCYGYLFPQY